VFNVKYVRASFVSGGNAERAEYARIKLFSFLCLSGSNRGNRESEIIDERGSGSRFEMLPALSPLTDGLVSATKLHVNWPAPDLVISRSDIGQKLARVIERA